MITLPSFDVHRSMIRSSERAGSCALMHSAARPCNICLEQQTCAVQVRSRTPCRMSLTIKVDVVSRTALNKSSENKHPRHTYSGQTSAVHHPSQPFWKNGIRNGNLEKSCGGPKRGCQWRWPPELVYCFLRGSSDKCTTQSLLSPHCSLMPDWGDG